MKDDTFDELTATLARHDHRIDKLESGVRARRESLTKISDRLDKLEPKVGEHSVGKVVERLGKTETRVAQEAAKVAELRRNVDALHRKVRLSGGLPHADFDTWHPDIAPDMVQAIRAGLASAPVSEAGVQKLRNKLEKAEEELVRWDESLVSALKAARALTDLPVAAERLWRNEVGTWLAFRRSGKRPVENVERARLQLKDAMQAHRSAETSAAKSEAADESARATIRERVEDAIARDLVTPQWFDSALGLFPPKEPGQIEAWLLAAIRLIRYRLLADVHERLEPFGDRPRDATLAREHDAVVELCSRQRR
ncbi:hypothetical protein ACSHWB_41240 [Lentzea sp. HUAS TT2]|uniref:hypothetical protein n=1 Tax=Lentzea sp. HUAS TT2 TaxID=3447454 RepID=UPI003F70A611